MCVYMHVSLLSDLVCVCFLLVFVCFLLVFVCIYFSFCNFVIFFGEFSSGLALGHLAVSH